VAAGILAEDERIELIGGEVVPMSPKGNHHEILKTALMHYWSARLPGDLTFTTETTFRLTPDTYLEPDFVFYPKASGIRGLSAATARLVVEIADSSLGYDLGRKAGLYAGFGITELWVIDAVRLVTHIHTGPMPNGYRDVARHAPGERLVPRAAEIGLVGADAVARLEHARSEKARARAVLASVRGAAFGGKTLAEALLRPEVRWTDLEAAHAEVRALALDREIAEALEIELKYAGYVERQHDVVARMRRQESVEIPADLDYAALAGLANEAKDKLARLRPRTLGAAARIAGVRPPDVALLAVHVERRRRERAGG